MVRVRRVTYETIIRGEPYTKWIEGSAEAWSEEGYALVFHGRDTIRIPLNKILDDKEYERTVWTQLGDFLSG